MSKTIYRTGGGRLSLQDLRDQRAVRRNTIPADKIPAFVRLIDAITERTGSLNAACARIGVHHSYVQRWREGVLGMGPDSARRILDTWRQVKAAKQ